jgi:hypothetical protein
MPSRKQRRREMKQKRHEYEFVYVDADGNELEEPPEGLEEETTGRATSSRNGTKPAAKTGKAQTPARRGSGRTPPVPSWNRAIKRGALLGLVVFALFAFTAKGSYVKVIPLAVVYTALFIPFTYMIDRFAYNRYQQRQSGGGGAKSPKKR